MSTIPIKLLFIKKYISYTLVIYLISNIKCNITQNTVYDVNNSSFKGIYRIDTYKKRLSLSYKYNKLILSKNHYLNNYFRIYLSEIKPYYYIELKTRKKKLGIKSNNKVVLYKNKTGNISKILWDIIEISPKHYLIQNQYNKKYLKKYLKKVKCSNYYYDNSKGNDNDIYINKDSFIFTFLKLYEEPEYKQEYIDIIEKESIDVVIKYIDLTDKSLNRTGIKQIIKDKDNEELRYSVRSILHYIPWVRKIFIIMPNEKVKYFKSIEEINKKIIYIKDKDLLGYDSANIQSFLFNFYQLDKFGVSTNFIYMDDDYFIGRPLKPYDFFYYDNNDKQVKPCLINYYFSELNKNKINTLYNDLIKNKDKIHPHSNEGWQLSLASTAKFFIQNYNYSHLINSRYTHNAIPMNIFDLKEIFNEIQKYEYINETIYFIQRHSLRLSCQYFYCLYNLNIKHRKVHSIAYRYILFNDISLYKLYTPLFVINTGYDKDLSPNDIKRGIEIIKKRFPYQTKYEIEENITLSNNYNNKKNVTKNKIFPIEYIIYLILVIIIISYYLRRTKRKKLVSSYIRIYNVEK